jgi:hypothetical protein
LKVRRIAEEDFYGYNGRRYSVDAEFSENEDYIYLKIKDIKESLYTGVVYNFECETSTFMCKNITTHNCDPIDSDSGTSLFSTFVFDLWTDTIVAEFTGRKPTANENYEVALKLALFYNAKINYENNLKGLYAYFNNKNMLYLLMETPQILRDQDLVKTVGYGNKALGTPANKAVNAWARKLLADWMVSEHKTVVDGEDGQTEKATIKLRTIRSIGLLKEAAQWNPDGNFDRISSMGMVMIAREELYKRTMSNRFSEIDTSNDVLDNDEFLNMNSGRYPTIEL